MIAKLHGQLDSAGESWAVIDVGGVGYLVSCTRRTVRELGSIGNAVKLYVHTSMRDSAIQLFGFPDPAEQAWFQALLGVQGVGAKIALSVLDVLPSVDLERAVASEDVAAVSKAEGVGRKGAARIVVELKDRISDLPVAIARDAGSGARRDALEGLISLGYSRTEALGALATFSGEGENASEILRLALKELAK